MNTGGVSAVGSEFQSSELDPTIKIIEAIRDQDINRVRSLITGKYNIHDGLLFEAVIVGNYDEKITQLLIEHKADVNAKNYNEDTPLHLASSNENEKVVKLLIDKKAEINATNKQKIAPIHIAATNKNSKVIKYLLDNGADPTIKNNDNETPLHFATKSDNTEVVKELLKKDVDVNAETIKEHNTPLHIAIKNKNKKMVELLLNKGAIIDSRERYGQTPLHIAAITGDKPITELLLERRAPVNTLDSFLITPLHMASSKQNVEIVRLLIDHGEKVKTVNDVTPLHIAAKRNDDIQIIRLLIDRGSGVNTTTRYNQTPLHYAAKNDNAKVAKLLLDKGARIDAVDSDGLTPLHVAYISRNSDVIELLLQRGANSSIKDKLGKVPKDYYDEKKPMDPDKYKDDATLVKLYNNELTRYDILNKEDKLESYKELLNNLYDWNPKTEAVQKERLDLVSRVYKYISEEEPDKYLKIDEPVPCEPVQKYIPHIYLDGFDTIKHLYKECKLTPEEESRMIKGIQNPFRLLAFIAYIIKYHLSSSITCTLTDHKIFVWFNEITDPYKEVTEQQLGVEYNTKKINTIIVEAKECNKDYIILQLGLHPRGGPGHANTVIIDNVNKRIIRFDPNGSTGPDWQAAGDIMIKKELYDKHFKDYKYINSVYICPNLGVQARQEHPGEGGFCVTWSIMYLHYYLLNPGYHEIDIHRHMAKGDPSSKESVGKQLLDQVRAYTKFMDNIAPTEIYLENDLKNYYRYLGIDFIEIVDPITKFFNAVNKGDLKKVEELLDAGVDIKSIGTLLPTAYEDKNTELVKLLLDKGADVNIQNSIDRTILHIAVNNKDIETVRLLLDKADVNIQDYEGNTALHLVTRYCGSNEQDILEIFNLLIDKSDPNIQNNEGNTPLHNTVRDGCLKLVKVLLEKGVDTTVKNKNGDTPLDIKNYFDRSILEHAIEQKDIDILKILVDKIDINEKFVDGNTALHLATSSCFDPEEEQVRLKMLEILTTESNINIQNNEGNTALHNAFKTYCVGLVNFLLEKGVDINIKNSEGKTPKNVATYKTESYESPKAFTTLGIQRQEGGGNYYYKYIKYKTKYLAAKNKLI